MMFIKGAQRRNSGDVRLYENFMRCPSRLRWMKTAGDRLSDDAFSNHEKLYSALLG